MGDDIAKCIRTSNRRQRRVALTVGDRAKVQKLFRRLHTFNGRFLLREFGDWRLMHERSNSAIFFHHKGQNELQHSHIDLVWKAKWEDVDSSRL